MFLGLLPGNLSEKGTSKDDAARNCSLSVKVSSAMLSTVSASTSDDANRI
jgi:hypothetical protein